MKGCGALPILLAQIVCVRDILQSCIINFLELLFCVLIARARCYIYIGAAHCSVDDCQTQYQLAIIILFLFNNI